MPSLPAFDNYISFEFQESFGMLEYPIHFKCKSKKRSKNSSSMLNTTESNTQSHIESCNDWQRIFDSQNLLENYGERRVELVVGQRQFYSNLHNTTY
ncbi:MAG: hypothetical protein MHMPM18_004373 [Marteilia pararefringens]